MFDCLGHILFYHRTSEFLDFIESFMSLANSLRKLDIISSVLMIVTFLIFRLLYSYVDSL